MLGWLRKQRSRNQPRGPTSALNTARIMRLSQFSSLMTVIFLSLGLFDRSGIALAEARTGSTPPIPSIASLPRVPWEGGSTYWAQFKNAAKWTDPSFFPVGIWFNGISSDKEVAWDKDHGINTYLGMAPETDFSLIARNNMFWIGSPLRNADPASPHWVGNFLDDEVDGRFEPEAGRTHLQSAVDSYRGNGKFNYANFTQIVISNDMRSRDAEAYVNNYADVVSVDMYWLTIPFCSAEPFRQNYMIAVRPDDCRVPRSYGKTVEMLRQREMVDGKLKPIWQFVEVMNGGDSENSVRYATGREIKAAVVASLIKEARGIVWFNSSLSGPCYGNPLVRLAQVQGDRFCGKEQVQAMGEINNLIKTLAPVLNSQSYAWSFGLNIDTMLKCVDGFCYIFAVPATSGSKTFRLPRGLASSIEVVGENRTLTALDNSFQDDFLDLNTYHIYRIPLAQ